jgi:hypothetical protein
MYCDAGSADGIRCDETNRHENGARRDDINRHGNGARCDETTQHEASRHAAEFVEKQTSWHAAEIVEKQTRDKIKAGANRRAAVEVDKQARDKKKFGFQYSPLDKGKSIRVRTGSDSFHGFLNSEHGIDKSVSPFESSEPISSPFEPNFNFNTPKLAVNSLQSHSSNQKTQIKDTSISFSSSPHQPLVSSSEIYLRPQLPKSKSDNDKHSMGGISTVQNISKMKDSDEKSIHSDRLRCDRTDSKGSTSCVSHCLT